VECWGEERSRKEEGGKDKTEEKRGARRIEKHIVEEGVCLIVCSLIYKHSKFTIKGGERERERTSNGGRFEFRRSS